MITATILGAIFLFGWFLHRLGTVIYWWLNQKLRLPRSIGWPMRAAQIT